MKAILVAGAALAVIVGTQALAEDTPVVATIPPTDVTVKVQAPAGTSDQDIAQAIAAENARRDPAAQRAAQVAKRKADEDQARAERVGKVCDAIPEKAMHDDPSLRKLCQ